MKLLIVEDNPAMRRMLKDMFQPDFEEIIECEDGSEAFESYKIYNPDWVFMDIKMKTMNGIEASRLIKSSDPKAKIIMVTDFNDKNFRKKTSEAGAIGYVLKENLSEIFDIININK